MEKKNFAYYWERIGTLMIFVFMILVTSVFAPPQFLSPGNLVQILTQSATTMLIACGEFFAILIAGIDLSVGSVLALSGVVTAKIDGGGHAVRPGRAVGRRRRRRAAGRDQRRADQLHQAASVHHYPGYAVYLSRRHNDHFRCKAHLWLSQSFKTAFGGMIGGKISHACGVGAAGSCDFVVRHHQKAKWAATSTRSAATRKPPGFRHQRPPAYPAGSHHLRHLRGHLLASS